MTAIIKRNVVKVETLEAISDHEYYIKKVNMCEKARLDEVYSIICNINLIFQLLLDRSLEKKS